MARGRGGDDGPRRVETVVPAPRHDVAVIGAGVVGSAIARELSRFRLSTILLEAGPDVGMGTSKANTAIWHTGYDAVPGSLEARLLRRSLPLMQEFVEEAGIAAERVGGLLVAWNEEELGSLEEIARRAAENGSPTRRIVADELYRLEPNLGPGAVGALEIPDEGIICPFTTPIALATQAVVNGVELRLEAPVTADSFDGAVHHVSCAGRPIDASWVVNAAGLSADVVDRLFVEPDASFTVRPRRGELIVFDKFARSLVSHVILPVPTQTTKGVLVAPTVFGNVLLGPTAEDVEERDATGCTEAGLSALLERGGRILPALLEEEVTATYAGLRAATEVSDYRIDAFPERRYVRVGGIRSTGLSGSLGIAEHVCELLADAGLTLKPKASFRPVRMPPIGETATRPYHDGAAIARDPDHGRIVCFCERVTRGEIRDALASPIPPRTIDALRRRTRATLGRCQGFFCSAEVATLLAGGS